MKKIKRKNQKKKECYERKNEEKNEKIFDTGIQRTLKIEILK